MYVYISVLNRTHLQLVCGNVINSTCLNFMYIEYFAVVYNFSLNDKID